MAPLGVRHTGALRQSDHEAQEPLAHPGHLGNHAAQLHVVAMCAAVNANNAAAANAEHAAAADAAAADAGLLLLLGNG